ncbi:MAG: phage terminase large subunit [Elusimicrobia bacterium]|nr:phage terminase large subunit [Elusimicrobiota bacterium]
MKDHEQRLEDLYFFAKEVLGYTQLTELHLSWFDILLREQYVLLLAPVGHLKTSSCTIAYPLFRLTENHNLRILLVNEVLDNAKGFLREIKGHLTQSARFREQYGHWDLTADTWTEERIQIPRTEIRKEPSIAVASVLGTVVSQHPDLVIVDDPCSNRNTQTPNQRQKVITWFQKDLLPRLDDGGQIIVVMTRWHTDDIAGFLKSEPGFANWKIIDLAAEWLDESGKQHILLPEKFSNKKLAQLKAQLGTSSYNCLYLNDPSGQEGSDFKAAWLDSGRYDRVPEGIPVFVGIDLAISRREGSSRFAYCVIGKDKAGNVYVIDAYRDRIPFNEQLKAAKRVFHQHHPCLMAVESNGYQAAFAESLRTDEETKHMPLKTINASDDKHARLRGLTPLFENGAIRLPKPNGMAWLTQLEEELLHFPHGSEDMLDALWLAIQALETQRVVPRIYYVGDSRRHDEYI